MPQPIATRKPKTVSEITEEVVERFSATPDPRLREIMQALVRHLHGFVDEVKLQEDEWVEAIQFLTATGQICTDKRQEFILLSDVLGVTMVTDLVTQNKPASATESTVLGPFYRAGAPMRAPGENMSPGDPGTPLILTGRVLDLRGNPVAGAELDTFQAGSTGFYDSQVPELDEMRWRGIYTTDREGRYLIRTVRPLYYQVPTDGQVGRILRSTARHSWRPAHIHFVITAPGCQKLTTHLFDSADPYLRSDTVFAVKDSLICTFTEHDAPDALAAKIGIQGPYLTNQFDFVMAPEVS
jgi:protocatechuate 3,4-dioxygenase beta subunit